ncbi:MAG: hypothetical protein Q4A54_08055 [Parabacteroides sp.]|nr:hypothetical protein [Parabacteroides sp.]
MLHSVLADFFPGQRLQVNLLVTAYDSGVVSALKSAAKIDDFIAAALINNLVEVYGIREELAKWAIDYWIDSFAIGYLNKSVQRVSDAQKKATATQNRKKAAQPSPKPIPPTTAITSNFIRLADLKDGEKIPKSMLHRFPDAEKALGITDIQFSVRSDFSYGGFTHLNLAGEYEGKTKQYIVMVVMVYNEFGELVGAEFDEKISDDFKGRKPFSTSVKLATEEHVAKIVLRLIPDPVFS